MVVVRWVLTVFVEIVKPGPISSSLSFLAHGLGAADPTSLQRSSESEHSSTAHRSYKPSNTVKLSFNAQLGIDRLNLFVITGFCYNRIDFCSKITIWDWKVKAVGKTFMKLTPSKGT